VGVKYFSIKIRDSSGTLLATIFASCLLGGERHDVSAAENQLEEVIKVQPTLHCPECGKKLYG